MNDNEAVVRIVGDASGVAPAISQTKGEIGELAPMLAQLNASMQDMASGMRQGFAQVTEQLAATKTEMAAVEAATEKEGLTLQAVAARAKEAALQVHEGVESFNSFKGAIREAAEAYLAFFAVERIKEWATELGEAAEQVHHLQQQFGLSTAQVQELRGIADGTGVPIEKIVKGMAMLDREAERSPEKFQKLGIEVEAGASQMDILIATAERFGQYSDGPTKVAAAMELMHRSGLEMIPVFDRGADGLQELITKAQEYGLVNEQAQASGMALAESVNESKLAWDGLKQTLTQSFGPLLMEITDSFNGLVRAMVDSYREGGAVKTVFEALVTVIEGFGEIFNSIGDGISDIFKAMGASAADWGQEIRFWVNMVVVTAKLLIAGFVALAEGAIAAFDMIAGALVAFYATLHEQFSSAKLRASELGVAFETLSRVMDDALSLRWGSIAADWQAGMNRLGQIARDGAAQIKSAFASESATADGLFGKGQAVGDNYAAFVKKLFAGPHAAPKRTGEERGGGDGGDAPNIGKQHQAKEKDDLVQHLDEQLKAREVAWAMEQDAQGSAQQYSLQSIADYWKAALDRDGLSQKDRLSIEEKYLAAHGQLVKQDIDKAMDGYKGQLAEFKANADQRLVIATAEAEFIKGKYGAESTEYAAAQAQIKQITQQVAEQRIALAKEATAEIEKLSNDELARQEAAAKFRVSMGLETQGQLLAQERQFEAARYTIQQQALAQQKAAIDPLHDPVKFKQVTDQIADLERQHQAKLTQIDQQAILQRTAIERTAITGTASLWGTNIAKLVTLQQGFATTIKSLYDGMVNVISTALSSVITKWLEQQLSAFLLKRAAQSADGAASVTSSAGIAAAAAYASTAAIPIIGPELAPAAAATALAATMSFAPLASAAGGWWQVPGDTLAAIHKDEMVLPAWASTPLRSMLTGGGSAANNNAPAPANDGAAGGGDTFHIHAVDAASFKKLLMDNHSAVGAAVRKHVRNNGAAGC